MDFVRDRDSRVYTTAFHFATMTVTTVGYGDTSSATQAAMVVVTVFVVFRAIFSYIVAIERQHDERGCTRRRGEERPGAGEAVVSAGGGWRGVPSAAPAPPRARRAHGGNGRGGHQSTTRNSPLFYWFCIFYSQKLILAITWLRVETENLSRFSLKPAGCPCSSVVRARDFYLGILN